MEALNYQYLTNPMAPEKFSEVTAKYINEISAYEFFSNPKNVKLQEAWILGRFGEHINALSVNLNTEKFPDAFAQVDHKTIKLEICEAYNPGRHRSREYEEDKTGKWSYDPVENWMPRCKASIAGLKTTVNKKMSKNYIQKCHLLIYIRNTGVNSLHEERDTISSRSGAGYF